MCLINLKKCVRLSFCVIIGRYCKSFVSWLASITRKHFLKFYLLSALINCLRRVRYFDNYQVE